MRPSRSGGPSIAFITSEYVTEQVYYGGLANYLHRVGLALASIGWRPHIVVAADRNQTIDGGVAIHRVDVRWPVPLRAFNRATFGVFARSLALLWQGWRLNQRLRQLGRSERFAIVQYSHLAATGIFRPRSLPAVARISGHQRLWGLAGDGCTPAKRHDLQQHRLELFALRRMDAVYSPSTLLARIWSRELRREIPTIENPFVLDQAVEDWSLFRQKLEGRTYVLFFGTLAPMKGVAVIARMIGPWLDRHPDLVFAFAGRDTAFGDGTMLQHLRNRAGSGRERVVHLGTAPHSQLYPIVARARTVILPSLIDNFPNACLEAMAHGRIVVATRGSGMDQLIIDGETGILCQRGDPRSLADAIERALALDATAAEAMGRRARQRIDRLAPERAGQELSRFYHSVALRTRQRSVSSRPIG